MSPVLLLHVFIIFVFKVSVLARGRGDSVLSLGGDDGGKDLI